MQQIPLELTMEQQFALRTYVDAIEAMPEGQARLLLIETMQQIMIKDNIIRHLMKEQIMGGGL